MKGQLIGIKHVSGISQKTGREFSFSTACITSDMGERDVERGSVGLDVHMPMIPEKWESILTEANVGKPIEVEFYYANGRENVAYCALLDKAAK